MVAALLISQLTVITAWVIFSIIMLKSNELGDVFVAYQRMYSGKVELPWLCYTLAVAKVLRVSSHLFTIYKVNSKTGEHKGIQMLKLKTA